MKIGFWHKLLKQATSNESAADLTMAPIRVVVAAFEDDCAENSGRCLYDMLLNNQLFDCSFYDDTIDKSFLNLQGRNFFDFYDAGQKILKQYQADVLIWGFRKDDKIRLNFQTEKQYERAELSLLDELCLPLGFFQDKTLPTQLFDLICAVAVMAAEVKNGAAKQKVLQNLVDKISREKSPQGLDIEYMPYILNMLALIYLQARLNNLNITDVKAISGMLDGAQKYAARLGDVLLVGSVYANYGKLYQYAAENFNQHRYAFLKNAIENNRRAQKCFNRYAYPYDFGLLAYRNSQLYFAYWRQISDVQALRDAVFNLREAEKIFSMAAFPYFWAMIQDKLGFYLSLLGLFSHSDEISMLAVENYKNRQKVFAKESWPLKWAKTQENIGNIFYNTGKWLKDESYLEESIKYYEDAAEIYENYKKSDELRQMQICVTKADEYIKQL